LMKNIFNPIPLFQNSDVWVHHFKVRKCGPLSPSTFVTPSSPIYFHKNNWFPIIGPLKWYRLPWWRQRMNNIFNLVPLFQSKDVWLHHFKVRKCGPLSPSTFGISSSM
jgi:hypothetical protein